MIRMVQSNSSGQAKAYFKDALQQPDYYLNDQELKGYMHGKLSDRLNITGEATKEIFNALCENQNPKTGAKLTQRTKQNRRVGYDINFHCPKSVSIIHSLSNDSHVLDAFQKSVQDTMKDIEADTKTRVRKGGAFCDREAGELAWGEFIHQTARPSEGHLPDPHLHAHCFVFNVTWDEKEKRFKAAEFGDIKQAMPYFQAAFHKRLADNMVALGYQVKATEKSFEVVGVPKEVIALFSKRTDEIGRIAKEKGITNAKDLDELGAKTRAKKQKGLGMKELKEAWRQQIRNLNLSKNEEHDHAVRFAREGKESKKETSKDCLNYALKHGFERASVLAKRRVLQTAYKQALGNRTASIDQINEEMNKDPRVIHVTDRGRVMCTTKEVLAEEKRMVDLAKQGQGKMTPLYHQKPEINLTGEQAEAVRHVLTSANRVSIIRGRAGTGKTTLMREAINLMKAKGKKVTVVAPTAQASRGVLKDEGYKDAETVAKLLVDKELQGKLKNQVLWVDEAGLLGTKDMTALLDLATKKNARLILGGDTRQHASVIRGDALRILNTVAGIKTAEVSKIYRQKNHPYRSAVEALSKGEVKDAFLRLDAMNAIKNVDPMKPNEQLVDDYVDAVLKKKSALVISPTHKQGEEVTIAIRKKLRSAGKIGKREISAAKLSNLSFTEAQKTDARNYEKGQTIQFNQNIRGVKRGSSWTVQNIKGEKVTIQDDKGKSITLPRDKADKFDVYTKSEISLAKGDKVQITRNGFDNTKKRLNNGMTLEVASVNKKGEIKLRNKASKAVFEIDKDFGHINHAHCITSHASQGKTVDEVFIAQPSATFPATDMKQFYVSVSRGQHNAHIYTDDREQLLEYASELGDRQSALELVEKRKTHQDYVQQQQRTQAQEKAKQYVPTKETITKRNRGRGYEPGY